MEAALVAGTLFQAYGQIQQGAAMADQYKAEADFKLAKGKSAAAQETAAAAERTVDRLRKLRQVRGGILVTGAGTGISTTSGVFDSLLNDSGGEFARDYDIDKYNTYNKASALRAGASSSAAILRAQASSSRLGGYMNAAGTLINYGSDAYNRGVFEKKG